MSSVHQRARPWLIWGLMVVCLVALAATIRRLPSDPSGFFTAPTKIATADELSPLGIPLGLPAEPARKQIRETWPATVCGQDGTQCFNEVRLEGLTVFALWNFRAGVLESVVVITNPSSFATIFTILNNRYGKPNDNRELDARNLYRWDRPRVTVGLDSAYPYKMPLCWHDPKKAADPPERSMCLDVIEVYVIFYVQRFEGERPKRGTAVEF